MKKFYKCIAIILTVITAVSVFCTVAYAEEGTETSEIVSEEVVKTKTYKECFDEIKSANWALTCGVLAGPAAVSVISIATPLIVFLPLSLPISVILGLGGSLVGIINTVFVPLEAMIMYISQ